MITSILLTACAVLGTNELTSEVSAPPMYVSGLSYQVEVSYQSGEAAAELDVWRLGPAAFAVDGQPLGAREGGTITLPANSSIRLTLDLSEALGWRAGSFSLEFNGREEPLAVQAFAAADQGLDFMALPAEELGKYRVLLSTNQGDMLVEFLPDKAPNHVRNFLDLSYTGFYEGILFHRVSPTFMIQGGCPKTKTNRRNEWGTGSGPRMLEAEFNDVKHERGVLSMARGSSPNSGSSQFFVMSARNAGLDGKYSAFGRLVSGFETLDAIAGAQGTRLPDGATFRPTEPQRIERATVLVAVD